MVSIVIVPSNSDLRRVCAHACGYGIARHHQRIVSRWVRVLPDVVPVPLVSAGRVVLGPCAQNVFLNLPGGRFR